MTNFRLIYFYCIYSSSNHRFFMFAPCWYPVLFNSFHRASITASSTATSMPCADAACVPGAGWANSDKPQVWCFGWNAKNNHWIEFRVNIWVATRFVLFQNHFFRANRISLTLPTPPIVLTRNSIFSGKFISANLSHTISKQNMWVSVLCDRLIFFHACDCISGIRPPHAVFGGRCIGQ